MFAIVRTGGKQYRVAPGDKIVVDRMAGEAGDTVTLDDVLFAGEGGDTKSTDGLKVSAEIVAQAKGEKVTVFKKKRRHNYRRKRGHRQLHTILRITGIGDVKAPKTAKKADAKPAAEAPAEKPAKTAKPEKAKAAAKEDVKSEPTAGEMTDTPKAKPAKAGAGDKAKAPKAEAKAPKAEAKAPKAAEAKSTKKPKAGKSK